MAKELDTLVKDMMDVLDTKSDYEVSAEDVADLGEGIASAVFKACAGSTKVREDKVLYASEVGEKCVRKLWFKINAPEVGEFLPPNARLKFLYGDIIEEVALFLAKTAGHKVSHQQHSVVAKLNNGWQVRGRIDAIIDNEIVDVKSASPYGYNKMVNDGLDKHNDAFGYAGQLDFYNMYIDEDEVGGVNTEPRFLVIDKQNGNVGLAAGYDDAVGTPPELVDLTNQLEDTKSLPDRGYKDETWTNGNRKLPINCSYCPFKFDCWPGLKVYSYSRGPIFATKVTKRPKNHDITEHYKTKAFREE